MGDILEFTKKDTPPDNRNDIHFMDIQCYKTPTGKIYTAIRPGEDHGALDGRAVEITDLIDIHRQCLETELNLRYVETKNPDDSLSATVELYAGGRTRTQLNSDDALTEPAQAEWVLEGLMDAYVLLTENVREPSRLDKLNAFVRKLFSFLQPNKG